MTTKPTPRRAPLAVRKETVRKLGTAALDHVAGGGSALISYDRETVPVYR